MLFKNDGIEVRKLKPSDNHLLAKWLSNPTVLEFYEGRDNAFDRERINKKFYNQEDDVSRCMIVHEGVDIGYIQYYPLDDTYRKLYGYDRSESIYGIDQFIGETGYWNKGIGTLLVTSMVVYLMEKKRADRVVMDPQTRNKRALKCYQKCGFTKVKILPNHEYHEGEYRDCWLLEYKK